MKNIQIFSFALAISLAGCTNNKNNTVIIHSEPADSIFTEIRFTVPTTEQGNPFEGGTTFRYEIDTVEVRSLYGRSSDGYFWTQVFITPGDSVSFKTVFNESEGNYDVIFEGKNAAHYNYDSQKSKAVQAPDINFFCNPDLDLLECKKQLQDFRDKEMEFLNRYKKENAVSNDFMNFALAEINNHYALKLHIAFYVGKCLQLPGDYLEDAVITQNPLSDFAEALKFKYIYCSPDENMERIYHTILNDVHPKFQSTLLSELINWFAR